MKNLLLAALLGAFVIGTMPLASAATSNTATTAKAKKKTVHKRVTRRKKGAAVAKNETVPDGAVKWSCTENNSFFLSGDMKRDQIVTLHWDGRNYRLPRQSTTTGADRFHDLASGMDLVVIPMKAMLFSDSGGTRLADECKDPQMIANGTPAPTQSNAINKSK
jgi:hypothetical protein